MLWIELIIFLAIIIIGARIGGIAMGTMAGIGLVIFIFVLKLPVGSPPVIVLGMILAVITALSTMEAAGGLDFLVGMAEKIMRKRPQNITFVAPLVTYILVLASGTQHVIYALLPIIAEISRKSGIRPERPMSMSVIAAMQGLVSSPISASTVAMIGILSVMGVSLPQMLLVIIPSTLIAVVIGSITVLKKGKELADDPIYQQRLKDGKIIALEATKTPDKKTLKNAKGSTFMFFFAIIMIVIIGMFPELRPSYEWMVDGKLTEDQIGMGPAIMIIMLAIGGLIMVIFKAKASKAVGGSIMKSGVVALISILGIAWLGSSFFEGNRLVIVESISQAIEGYQWVFGFGLFTLSIMLFSQAATVVTLMPVGLALGLDAELLIALYPAVNGYFVLPTYGTILAAISFDQTGTTKIGNRLVNHSFMVPGLVTTFSAVIIALLITYIT
ncbi:anaerobic C4-dicarboxylate transporter DcuA [Ancylomarina subtilis]|uniref:Anaerobic C4-dicarboxylate transporter DcuA n=1 Tax=Ancylomarina subtilis TaxID=1639035 RepID=A0A4Q7VI33_9BACT|nr:anaerobic C4-dicarboxylate transporter family protein [Ancylomarina subtilis]RZT95790.1 anaerobic C4-dicarboxylate transporter DcuA [Ancylomarina subtilis]